ncbi:MAG: hypothetical protein NTU88_15165 [Armatimonadetes bacterium]|nr:hypothetical protein [Armatimonadota bacterium]
MGPEDEMLWRTVLYVGLGVGVLCMAAALALQIRMLRKGKATRKDVRDLVTLVLYGVPCAALGVLAIRAPGYEPSGKVSAAVGTLFVAWWTCIIISRLPEIIRSGTDAVATLARSGGVRAVIWLAMVAAAITMTPFLTVFGLMLFMPASWTLRVIVVFVGSVAGLIWRWVLLTRTDRPG